MKEEREERMKEGLEVKVTRNDEDTDGDRNRGGERQKKKKKRV